MRSKRRHISTGLTPARPIKLADEDLDPDIRGVLDEFRDKLAPYGWIVSAEKVAENLSFQFDNPLSGMSAGIGFEPGRPLAEIRQQLEDGVLAGVPGVPRSTQMIALHDSWSI